MRSKSNNISCFAGTLVAAVLTVPPLAGCGQQSREPTVQSAPRVSVDKDGTVHLPAFEVPLSSYMSEQAKQVYIDQALHPPAPDFTATISQQREAVDKEILSTKAGPCQSNLPGKYEGTEDRWCADGCRNAEGRRFRA